MKNFSKEFWLKKLHITIGTHWHDWSLPLRIFWIKWKNDGNHTFDILIDFFCFVIYIEIWGE